MRHDEAGIARIIHVGFRTAARRRGRLCSAHLSDAASMLTGSISMLPSAFRG